MKKLAVLIFIIVGAMSTTYGQTATGAWTLGPNWTYNRNMSNLELARIAMQGELNKNLLRNGQAKSVSPRKRKIAQGVTAFKIDQPHIVPQMVASQNTKMTAGQKKQLEQTLDGAINKYKGIIDGGTFPVNDVTTAMLYFFVNNLIIHKSIYQAATDPISGKPQYLVSGFYSPTDPQEAAIWKQFNDFLQKDKNIAGMSDRDKQQIAEMIVIKTNLFIEKYQYEKSRRNMNEIGIVRQIAEDNIENLLGHQIENIKITDNGLIFLK